MKKFTVIASYTSYCETEIEASTEEEAWRIAKEMDGGSFTPCEHQGGDWTIEEVNLIEAA